MNTIYRLIWSKVSNAWVAVAEGTRAHGKGHSKGHRRRSTGVCNAGGGNLAVALILVAMAAMAGPALAGPDGGMVTAGTGSISQSGNVTSIVQGSKNLSLNWNNFNVGSAETVNFIQPSTSALAINRIVGGNASEIMGRLNANGQVYLINPSGILFGAGAQVNVGSLVASTMDLNGDPDSAMRRFSSANAQGSIVNQGVLRAVGTGTGGGYIALLGNQVVNQGLISARMGSVALAAGNTVTLSFAGDSLVNVQVDQSTFKTLVDNRGVIVAEGGQVLMTAGARDAILESLASNSGVVEARGLENRDGKIVLTSGGANGSTTVGGRLDVSSAAGNDSTGAGDMVGTTGKGGTIAVGGRTIALGGATLDASGANGGGLVTVGGGFHGQAVDGATTAQSVVMDGASSIRAVARENGSGGQVVIWADGSTRFDGLIDARATGALTHGTNGAATNVGSGGNAEVSAAGQLDYRGTTNLLSSRGATGNLLLDPYDITISAATSSNANTSTFTATGNNSVINNVTLQAALATANVTGYTGASGTQSGNITVTSPVIWTGANTLTLNAAGAIAIDAPIVGRNAGSGLTLSAGAGQSISASGAINVGTFTLSQGNWLQNSATLPTFQATNFSIASGASFLRASGGSGTLASPYLINDIFGLQGVGSSATYLAGNYALAANIDATTTSSWNSAAGFLPIGSSASPFTGTLKGRNNAILGLTINRPALTTGVGLFGHILDGGVSDLSLLNVAVTGGSNGVGALAGRAYGSSAVSGIVVTGAVNGANSAAVDNIGGIIGNMMGTSTLSASASAVNVTGYNSNNGGAVGGTDTATVMVTSTSATGTVSGKTNNGGLVGLNTGSITDSYATGAVATTNNNGGGLVGRSIGSIARSYGTGAVTGTGLKGGIVGDNTGQISNTYWNTTTSGLTSGYGANTGVLTNLTGVTTAAMHTQSTFAPWDFATIWAIVPGFNPTLRAGTTIVGNPTGNLTISTAADSTTVLNTGSLLSLLNAGNVMVANGGTLTVANSVSWNGASRLGLASSGTMNINAGLGATGAGSMGLYSTANGVNINNTTLATNGGSLDVFAPRYGTNDGIRLTGASISTGSGNASLSGNANSGNGVYMAGANTLSTGAGGSIRITGNSNTNRGILQVANGNLTTSGNVSLVGGSIFTGVAFCTNTCATSSVTNLGGNLSISGTSYAAFNGGAAVDMYGQTLSNLGSGSLTVSGYSPGTTALYISGGTAELINTGGGTLSLSGVTDTAYGVYLANGSAINSTGNVSISGKTLSTASTLPGFISNGSHVITSNSGNLSLIGGDAALSSTGFSANGNLTLNNNGSGTLAVTGNSGTGIGLNLGNVNVVVADNGGGSTPLTGNSNTNIGVNMTGANSLSASGATTLSLTGNNTSTTTAAIQFTSASTLTTSGTVNMTGNANTTAVSNAYAFFLSNNNTVTAQSGNLTLTGNGTTARGIAINASLINQGAGTLSVLGNSTSNWGLQSNGTIAFNANTATYGSSRILVQGQSVSNNGMTTGGTLSTTGKVEVRGISDSSRGIDDGTAVWNNLSGTLSLTGISNSYIGVRSSATYNNSGDFTLSGDGGVLGVYFRAGSYNNINNGVFDVTGRAFYATAGVETGAGIKFNPNTYTFAGALNFTGSSTVPTGTFRYRGIDFNAAVLNNSGTLRFSGSSTDTTSAGIEFTGNTTINNTGTLTLSGSSPTTSGTGIWVPAGISVTNAGNTTLTDAASSLAAEALHIDGTLLTTGGTMTITPASNGNVRIGSTGTLASTGSTALSVSASGSGALDNSGTIAQQAGGSGAILLNTVDGTLSNTGLISIAGGSGAIMLKTTGSGAIDGTGGTINQAGTGAISLLASGGGNIGAGAIGYANAAAGSLTISGLANVGLNQAIASTGGALSVNASGSAVSLSTSINSNGGDIAITGPVSLTAGSTLSAGAGQINISSTVDGNQNLDASAAAIHLSQTVGGTTALADVTLTSAGSMTLPSVHANTLLARTTGAGADLTLAAGTQLSTTGSGNATTLAAGRNFINNAGANAIATAAGARWLVYSSGPAGNVFGNLDSASTAVWNTAFAVTPAFSQAGNRYVFAMQPTLTFTALDLGKTYGADASAALAASYSVSGLQGAVSGAYLGDSAASVYSGAPLLVSSGTAVSATVAGGPYSVAISQGGVTSLDNYALSFQSSAQLTVDRAALTATANNAVKTYDGLAYTGGAGVSYSGFVNGETPAVLSGAPSYGGAAQGAVNAGSHALTVTGLASDNYAISYQPGALTISPAALSITAADAAKTYDGQAYSGGAGVAYNGFVNGETPAVLTGTLGYGGAAQGAIAAGSHALVATGLASDNYAISYVPGTLNVAQAALTVSTGNMSKTYDGLSYSGAIGLSYSGFVNGETASVLSGATTYGGTALGAVNAGSYTLTAAGLSSNNYSIDYLPGTLSITQALLTARPNDVSKTYDGQAYSGNPGMRYTGFVNGETSAVLSGAAVYGGSAQGAVNAGSYTLTATGQSAANYAIAWQPGTLTVAQAPLIVAVNDAFKTYDGLAYGGAHGVAYSGFVNGETTSILSGTLAYGGEARSATDAGNHAITASGLNAVNYAISYRPGTLSVARAPLTVMVNAANKTYDGLAYSGGAGVRYSGFVAGDSSAVIAGAPVYGGTAQGAVDAGTYTLTAGGLSASNYALTYNPAELTVGKASLLMVANSITRVRDGQPFAGGAGVRLIGLVNDETASVLSGSLVYGGTAQGATATGSYGLSVSGLTSKNYAIGTMDGFLTLVDPVRSPDASDVTRWTRPERPVDSSIRNAVLSDAAIGTKDADAGVLVICDLGAAKPRGDMGLSRCASTGL